MAFRVKVSARAKRDLDDVLKWLLTQEAGEAGFRWFQGMRDAVASLSTAPRRCILAPEDELFAFEVRQLFHGNKPHVYRILFTIEENTVTVLHIRHGRRLPHRDHAT